jgi:hypothetical protein
MLLEVFNDVVKPGKPPPAEWLSSRLTVIFKKGDPEDCANYRPIAIIPIMYKIFTRMLCERLQENLGSNISVDQAAYRKGFSTVDHLISTTLLAERCEE